MLTELFYVLAALCVIRAVQWFSAFLDRQEERLKKIDDMPHLFPWRTTEEDV